MGNELVSVDFHGDTLECVERDGQIWVSVSRVCDSIGIDLASQLRKIRDDECCSVVEMTTVGADGKSRSMSMIDLDSLPWWLSTIKPNKVKPEIRDKVIRYRKECARVLRDHFLKPKAEGSLVSIADLESRVELMLARRDDQIERLARAFESLQNVAVQTHPQLAAGVVWSINERLDHYQWFDAEEKDKAAIRLLVSKLLLQHLVEKPFSRHRDLIFYPHQLPYLDQAIELVRKKARLRVEEENLFSRV